MGKVKLGDIAVLINGDRGKNYPSQKEIITVSYTHLTLPTKLEV